MPAAAPVIRPWPGPRPRTHPCGQLPVVELTLEQPVEPAADGLVSGGQAPG